eukprot:6462888-Amphidinium_carterae.1
MTFKLTPFKAKSYDLDNFDDFDSESTDWPDNKVHHLQGAVYRKVGERSLDYLQKRGPALGAEAASSVPLALKLGSC